MKKVLGILALIVALALWWCGLWSSKDTSSKEDLIFKQVAIKDVFEVKEIQNQDYMVDLLFSGDKYGSFAIKGVEQANPNEASLMQNYFESGFAYEVDQGRALLIPILTNPTMHESRYLNYYYDIQSHTGHFLDKVCVGTAQATLSGSMVKYLYQRKDFDWIGSLGDNASAMPLEEWRYCDLKNYSSGSISNYTYLSEQWKDLQTGDQKKLQQVEKELISAYYQLMTNRDFDRQYAVSLFKWAKKDQNPFWERYDELWSGAVKSITPQWDHSYEVANTLEFCYKDPERKAEMWGPTTPYDCDHRDSKSYKSIKKIVLRDDKVYVDTLDSRETTKRRVCDKVVKDDRRSIRPIIAKEQYPGDVESYWTIKGEEDHQTCSDFVYQGRIDWESIMGDIYSHLDCWNMRGEKCQKTERSWSSSDGKYRYFTSASEWFILDEELWPEGDWKFTIDWIKVDHKLIDGRKTDDNSFVYKKDSNRFYLVETYPFAWFCMFQDVPMFSDDEINQKVWLVTKECHIVGED